MIGEPSLFMQNWSWMGLGAAIVLLIVALCTDIFRSDLSKKRWFDPAWLAWIGAIEYMLHNFEEYGYDLRGVTMSFPKMMTDVGKGNVDQLAYLGCNIVLIWICAPIIACLAKKYKAIAPSIAIFTIFNMFTHIIAIFGTGYNAGLLTSLVLFIPIGLWTIYVCFVREKLGWGNFTKSLLVTVLYSIVLGMCINLANKGMLSGITQGIIMIIDGFVCTYLWYLIGKKASTN